MTPRKSQLMLAALAKTAAGITTYNPDDKWKVVSE